MKLLKCMLAINGVTLVINGIIVWLTVVKTFPPALGVLLFLGAIAGAIWLSCYVNGYVSKPRRIL